MPIISGPRPLTADQIFAFFDDQPHLHAHSPNARAPLVSGRFPKRRRQSLVLISQARSGTHVAFPVRRRDLHRQIGALRQLLPPESGYAIAGFTGRLIAVADR